MAPLAALPDFKTLGGASPRETLLSLRQRR